MVRTALCQQHGAAIQYRCYCLYHYTCSEHHLGSIRKLYGNQPPTHEYLFYAYHCPVGYPILRTRSKQCHYRYYRTGSLGTLPVRKKTRSEIPDICTHHEYRPTLYHDDHGRLFVVCPDRYPFNGQHSDGPKLSRRYLHTGRILGT